MQGAELDILRAAPGPLHAKVKRVHVETHSRQLHVNIARFFRGLGWRCHVLFEGNTGDETAFGRINFQGGVQSWLNSSINSAKELRSLGTYQNSVGFRVLQAGRKISNRAAPVGTARRKFVRACL